MRCQNSDGRKQWGLRWLDLDGARLITSANGKIYVGNAGGWRGKNTCSSFLRSIRRSIFFRK